MTKEELDWLVEYYRSKYKSDEEFYDSLVLFNSKKMM